MVTVTTALERPIDLPLAPITATLREMFGTSTDLPGLAPDLLVTDPTGWAPAATLTAEHLDTLVESARRRWTAPSHAAATLAWKNYAYWLALPAVLGWTGARRVPLLAAEHVLIHFADPAPLVTIGLRADIPVAVLPGDPLADAGLAQVRVVAGEAALLREFRRSLLDEHLALLLDQIHSRVRVSRRPLLGSLASGVAQGVLRAPTAALGSTEEDCARLLGALGVEDLIQLLPDRTGRLDVQRKTCCLAFTLPQPKVCRGCCIKNAH